MMTKENSPKDMVVIGARDDAEWRGHMLEKGTIVIVVSASAPYAWKAVDGHTDLPGGGAGHALRFFTEELCNLEDAV